MTTPDFKRLETVFQRAVELEGQERATFLEQACCGDAVLRGAVEDLLGRDAAGKTLPPAPALAEPVVFGEGVGGAGPGDSIGRYKLLQEIGEGGFGVVYMAEQREPVIRKVALKLIKAGMDSKEVIARFEAERQALALMDHPHIASVLDGGETEGGRPYFVMELVRGVPITEYCDNSKLSIKARLVLFEDVCGAIQHAHQKGVIHRDLKPSNILVSTLDGKPVVKVIDFGVAKAIHQPLTERTLFTAYGRFIGTPAYMSPEQAQMSAVDVDTRSDIYSLGVLLFELLTGTTPFDVASAIEAGLAELQRVIREEEPQRPSVRISTCQDAGVASARSADPRSLGRALRGELDWIIIKALAKERDRRYGTAAEFAADVRRYLDGDPVAAGPPTASYRLRKLLGRHRGLIAAVGAVLFVLVLGVIGLSHGLILAGRERDAALASRADGDALNRFLIETIALTDPAITNDPNASVRDLLDRAAARATDVLAGRSWAEAGVRATIGRAYLTLGETELAESNLRRAMELFGRSRDVDPLELYRTAWHLTGVAFQLERPDAWECANRARALAHACVEERSPRLARELKAFTSGVEASVMQQNPGRMHVAQEAFARSLDLAREDLPGGDPLWPVLSDTYLAGCLAMWYSPLEVKAERFYEEAYAIRLRELGPVHFDTATILTYYIGFLNRIGQPAKAEALTRAAVSAMGATAEEGNPHLAFLESLLGETLTMLGRYGEAEDLLLKSHERILAPLGSEDSFLAVDSLARIVALYSAWQRPEPLDHWQSRLATVAATARQVLPWQLTRRAFGASDAELLGSIDRLHAAIGGWNWGVDPGRAIPEGIDGIVQEVLRARRSHATADSDLALATARSFIAWAHALDPRGAAAARAALLEDAVEILRPHAQALPSDTADALALLASVRAEAGDRALARGLAEDAWHLLGDRSRLNDNYVWATSKGRVGATCLSLGLMGPASELLTDAYTVLQAQFGPAHPDTLAVARLLESM